MGCSQTDIVNFANYLWMTIYSLFFPFIVGTFNFIDWSIMHMSKVGATIISLLIDPL